MKHVAYLRLSTDRTGALETLDSQEAIARRLATVKGESITEVVSEGAGVSAKTGTKQPELEKVLQRVENGEAITVYASEVSRLSRSAVMTSRLRLAVDQGLTIVTPSLDTSAASGVLLLSILAELATEENAIRGARVAAGMARGRARDEHQGKPPWPMTRVDGALVPHPVRGAMFQRMLAEFLSGDSVHAVTTRQHQQHPEHSITGTVFKRLIENESLAGYRDGKRIETWEALVPLADLHRAQRKHAQAPQSKTGRPTRRPKSLLGGLAVCGGCGDKVGRSSESYRCQSRKFQACAAPVGVRTYMADRAVLQQVQLRLANFDETDPLLISAAVAMGMVDNDPTPERERLSAELAEVDARAEMLSSMFADGRLDPEQFASVSSPVFADQRRLRDELANIPTGQTVDVSALLDYGQLDEVSRVPDATWRSVLEALGATVTLSKKAKRGDPPAVTVAFPEVSDTD